MGGKRREREWWGEVETEGEKTVSFSPAFIIFIIFIIFIFIIIFIIIIIIIIIIIVIVIVIVIGIVIVRTLPLLPHCGCGVVSEAMSEKEGNSPTIIVFLFYV